jgi:hypothetical protein
MLVGRGDVDGTPYLNMGFRPAWMYAEAHDLTFVDGRLTDARDLSAGLSADLAAVRDGITGAGPDPGESHPRPARPHVLVDDRLQLAGATLRW